MNSPGNFGQGNLNAWELKHLVKSGLFPDETMALRSALRALFQMKPDTRVRMVVSAYQSTEISLGKAAAMLGVSQEEMKESCARRVSKYTLAPKLRRKSARMPTTPEPPARGVSLGYG
jgi:hypothetical protein